MKWMRKWVDKMDRNGEERKKKDRRGRHKNQ